MTLKYKAHAESFDFFALLLSGIVSRANNARNNIRVYVPKKEKGDQSNQPELLRHVLANFDDFDALIIAPLVPDETTSILTDYFQNGGTSKKSLTPIVFIDKRVDFNIHDPERQKRHPIYNVFCDNKDGGKLAAKFLHSKLKPVPHKFMVLRGLVGSEARIDGFSSELSAIYGGNTKLTVAEDDELNFSRADARSWMLSQIERLEQNDPKCLFGSLDDAAAWGIFSCNDEMALGVRSIIANRANKIRHDLYAATNATNRTVSYQGDIGRDYRLLLFLQNLRIVGFDGIYPALELIKPSDEEHAVARDPWLLGTIQANIDDQAGHAMDWLIKSHQEGNAKPNTSREVEVSLYR